MVVLVAAIVTKSGKAILSRQFCEIQRSRVEGLLAAFPKLTSAGKQHTTIETENVRYVYQPLEELFMVLVTNRQSNILQDIESLHLFARVVTDLCRNCTEYDISKRAFEVLCAFDEIITEGYRENVRLAQVKSNIIMESHEERNQEIIAKNKEREAKEELKRRAKQFEMQRKEATKRGQGFMQGNFSGASGQNNTSQSFGADRYSPSIDTYKPAQSFDRPSSYSHSSTPPVSQTKGMKLGRKAKASDLFEALKTDVVDESQFPTRSNSAPPAHNADQNPIHLNIEERVSMIANRDGDLDQLDIRGVLTLRIADPASAKICFKIRANDDSAIQFKTHPNVDKSSFKQEHSVQMKDISRPFPVNQNLEVVRWKFTSQDDTDVPLTVNCWPSPAGDGTCDVNIEYELEADLELHDVVITLPLPAGPKVNVSQVDGSYFVDAQRNVLEWTIPVINNGNRSGVLECSVAGDTVDGFFPVSVSFTGDKLICGVDVEDIFNLDAQLPAEFSKDILLLTEDYVIG
ncbi:hypothetical protein MBANPS3_012119 [Mucor bainieri]